MITVPTCELVGLLTDTIPFANPDKDSSGHVIRIDWDAEQETLHASASDGYRVAWSTWHTDDDPEQDVQDCLFTAWGGNTDEDSWTAVIGLEDAKDAARMFKLGKDDAYTPVQVALQAGQLRVSRTRDTGHSAITHVMRDATTDQQVDPRSLLDKLPDPGPAAELAFTACLLADFAKVRPRGPMVMTFAGPDKAVRVRIGERFTGAVMPVRVHEERLAPAA